MARSISRFAARPAPVPTLQRAEATRARGIGSAGDCRHGDGPLGRGGAMMGRAMRWQDPVAGPGQAVGLLGGSFDPPHAGHAHLTREALKRLGLDRVWWLVSPANPLKLRAPAPMAARLAACRRVIDHPRVTVTDIETRLGTRATIDTLRALGARYPHLRFVWLMGADNLAGFHRWEDWQEIMTLVPVAVLARPGQRMAALNARAARQFAQARLPARAASRLAAARPPAWIYLDMPMRRVSSTALRSAGGWATWHDPAS